MSHSHRIRRLRWQVHAPDTAAAFALRGALRRENERLMLPALASAFEAADNGNAEVLLPRLALHLRLSHPDRLCEELPEQIYTAALSALAALLAPAEPGHAAPRIHTAADRLGHYLLNGSLPWFATAEESATLARTLSAEASAWLQTPAAEPDTQIAMPTQHSYSHENPMERVYAAASNALAALLAPEEARRIAPYIPVAADRPNHSPLNENLSRSGIAQESAGLSRALSAEAPATLEPDIPAAAQFSGETQAWLRLLAIMPADAAAAFAFAFRYLQLLMPSEREALLKAAGETKLRSLQNTTELRQQGDASKDAEAPSPFKNPESTGMQPALDNTTGTGDAHMPFIAALHRLMDRDTGSSDAVLRRQAFSLVILGDRRFSEFTPPTTIDALLAEIFGFPEDKARHSGDEILSRFFPMPQMTQQETVAPHSSAPFEEEAAHTTKHTTKVAEQARSIGITVSTEAALPVFYSGLILLHPFLPRLFSALNWIQEAGKLNTSRLPNAAALLHWMATGSDTPYEFEFSLIKVLLGLRPEDPLPAADGCLGATEREEGAALLSAAIEHWSALRNTSIDGLRTAFLQRRGFLRPVDGGWSLHPENKSFDLLLDALPWGIGIVKLPWMPVTIFTEWASR